MLFRLLHNHASIRQSIWRNSSVFKVRCNSCDKQIFRFKSSTSSRSATSGSSDFKRILALALPERYRLGAAIGLLVVSSSISMAVPYAIGKIIDIIYNLDQLKDKTDQETQKQLIRDRLKKVG